MFVTFIISISRGFGNLSRYSCFHLGSCIQEFWFKFSLNTFRLNKLKESGQLDKYWLQWKPQARKDCLASQNIDPIKIQIVVSLFIMLSAFIIISVAIYIIEVLMKKKIVRSNSAMEAKDSFNNVTSMRAFTQNKCTFKENQSNLVFLKESARRSNGRKIKCKRRSKLGLA